MTTLLSELLKFRNDRNWQQYHTPKNLACAIASEAGELMHIFRWKKGTSYAAELSIDEYLDVEEEIADIYIFLLLLAHELEIDIDNAAFRKIEKNGMKYPINSPNK